VPGTVGEYQIKVQVPAGIASGSAVSLLKYGRIRIESGDNPREVNTKGLGILENLFSGKASTRGMNVVIKHYRLLPKTR
jgi:hypothetical protein